MFTNILRFVPLFPPNFEPNFFLGGGGGGWGKTLFIFNKIS
jgi:hypothetical protein